jgi:hypothetical protein
MNGSAGIHCEESENSLRLSWDNRELPKKRFLGSFLILFWMVWTSMTLFVTALAFQARGMDLAMLLIWLLFGWVGVLAIPYTLLMRSWGESIIIDDTSIMLSYSGLLARRSQTIPLGSIDTISIGHVQDSDGGESIQTLNIYLTGTKPLLSRRLMVAYWLPADLQNDIFRAIEAFVEKHSLNVQMTRLN